MRTYKLIEYSDNNSKFGSLVKDIIGHLWQYYRDYPNNVLRNSESFNLKINITGKNPAVGNTKDVKSLLF